MQATRIKDDISGFSYLSRQLDLQSGVGRELLSRARWYRKGEEPELLVELSRIERLKDLVREGRTFTLEKLKRKFSQVLDIRGTFALLQKGDVDDVQLFEVKRFALLTRDCAAFVSELTRDCAFHPAPAAFPDLGEVVSILDPRNENLPAFYIYDEYDALLARKRKEIQVLSSSGTDEETMGKIASLQEECLALEQGVRLELARRLSAHVDALQESMRLVAYWDLLTAKAYMAAGYGMVMPRLQDPSVPVRLRYKGLFHPMVKRILEEKGHRYQRIDVSLLKGPCLLTGANMSGKTVLLKSIALSQCLLQSGFLVPAEEADMVLFDRVELLVQDGQDEERGLSSFGAEMQRLNTVFGQLRQGVDTLLLVDELARTTNPDEGKAIVCAVLESLQSLPCVAMVSTHYGPVPNPVRRLRVRGFRQDWLTGRMAETLVAPQDMESRFDISHIQSCMDYSLTEEEPGGKPPAEALRIAGLLGFDAEVLALAGKYLERRI